MFTPGIKLTPFINVFINVIPIFASISNGFEIKLIKLAPRIFNPPTKSPNIISLIPTMNPFTSSNGLIMNSKICFPISIVCSIIITIISASTSNIGTRIDETAFIIGWSFWKNEVNFFTTLLNVLPNSRKISFISSWAAFIFSCSVASASILSNWPSPSILAAFSAPYFCLAISYASFSWSFNSRPILFKASCSYNIEDISSLLIPTALAIASCWRRFILAKSAADPAFLAISSATVFKSLFKAACLAFSRFNFFPVNNSASISAWMEDSKSSKPPAILSTWAISIPKDLTVTIVFAKAPVCFP